MTDKNKNTADFRSWYFSNTGKDKKDLIPTITEVMGWKHDTFKNKLSGRTALTKTEVTVLIDAFKIDRSRFFLIEVDSTI